MTISTPCQAVTCQCGDDEACLYIRERDAARARLAEAEQEISYWSKKYNFVAREVSSATPLADNGDYRNDLAEAIKGIVSERDTARARLAEVERELDVVRELAQSYSKSSVTQGRELNRSVMERDAARAQVETLVEALVEISTDMRWGEDTAIKRTITGYQNIARAALKAAGVES